MAESPLQQSAPLTAQSVFERVGFSSHLVSMPAADDYAYMQRATAAGVHWFREDFPWSGLEPQKGRYNWAPTDTLMTNASKLTSAPSANLCVFCGRESAFASS